MKKFVFLFAALCICLSMSGCGLMEDAFKAGVIITLVIMAIIGLLIWILHLSWKLLTKYFPAIRLRFEGFWDE